MCIKTFISLQFLVTNKLQTLYFFLKYTKYSIKTNCGMISWFHTKHGYKTWCHIKTSYCEHITGRFDNSCSHYSEAGFQQFQSLLGCTTMFEMKKPWKCLFQNPTKQWMSRSWYDLCRSRSHKAALELRVCSVNPAVDRDGNLNPLG